MSTGMQNLGGASFTVHANMESFKAGMAQARKIAMDGSNEIKRWMDSVDQSSRKAAQGFQQMQAPLNAVRTSSTNAAMGMLVLGQAIDDAQYGFRSIVNNIPQLGMVVGTAMGASAAASMQFAGAIGIVAVGLNQLITHFDAMNTAMQAAWSGSTVAQLETIRVKAEAAGAALAKVPGYTQAQGKQAAAVEEFVQSVPKEKLIQQVAGAIQGNPSTREEMTQEDKWRVSDAKSKAAFTARDERIRAARVKAIEADIAADIQKRVFAKAEKIVGEALLPGEQGDLSRTTIGMLLPQHKAQLEALSPKGQKQAADAKEREEKAKRVFDTDQAAKDEQMKMMAVARDDEARKKAAREARLQGEFETDQAGKKERDKMMSAVTQQEGEDEKQKGWELQGRDNARKFELDRQHKEEATAKKLADSPIALQLLRGQHFTPANVDRVMKAGGIDTRAGGQRPAQVLEDLKKDLRTEIADTMLRTGATEREARRMVTIGREQRLIGQQPEKQHSEMVGLTDLWKKIQTGALNGNDNVQKQQLAELAAIRQAILNRNRGAAPAARAT
jgi:hypothetical protein